MDKKLERASYLLDEIEVQVTKAVERLAELDPSPQQQEGKLALSRAELKQVQTWIRNWRMS